ncbi:hypothetical protein HME9304_00621 [Flagellimonas maritima]|uniref:Methylamine utilisation protein MauE domain-containing protein n=1 Tax=Flagellimonas maritima TaxID=1383885 RepID=A0A2Z4LPF0_9FLAO|nr:MauE/DoxX family redox-associated membrane protein [Allomuricauda aurantiaca]AWX43630.1 hypothetical protein HME9304_00621 [Allomuricauda aurantiaca]
MAFKGNHPIILQFIKVLFIILFVYTASSKLMQLGQFQNRLDRFPFISSYSVWIAFGVPFVELVIVGLFLVPRYLLTALCSSFTLLFLFTAYIVTVLHFSDSIPCSCGGALSALGWKDHILFNTSFMLLALLGILLVTKKSKRQALNQNTT